jgi:hypothetical protein
MRPIRPILISILTVGLVAWASHQPSVKRPEVIDFGSPRQAMVQALQGYCSSIEERKFDPPQVPEAKSHSQIDCQGFEYFGAPRLAEFVFADDELILTWILVDDSELAELENAFIARFGEPTIQKDDVTAFTAANAAVRKDVPEALYYADSVAPLFEAQFNSQ